MEGPGVMFHRLLSYLSNLFFHGVALPFCLFEIFALCLKIICNKQTISSRYNSAQRDRNKYEGMSDPTKQLLNRIFCPLNQDLALLLADLHEKTTPASTPAQNSGGGSSKWVQVPLLLPEHGYSCV